MAKPYQIEELDNTPPFRTFDYSRMYDLYKIKSGGYIFIRPSGEIVFRPNGAGSANCFGAFYSMMNPEEQKQFDANFLDKLDIFMDVENG